MCGDLMEWRLARDGGGGSKRAASDGFMKEQ